MKKLIATLLTVVMICSLAATAFAADPVEVPAETDRTYLDAVELTMGMIEEDDPSITLTRPTKNFFVMKARLSSRTVLSIETDSEDSIKGWHCFIYYLEGSTLVGYPFLTAVDNTYDDAKWVIDSISKDSGFIEYVGDNSLANIGDNAWVGFSLLSELTEDVSITVKVYQLGYSDPSAIENFDKNDPDTYGELVAQTTYTFEAPKDDTDSSLQLDVNNETVKCGETVDVTVKASEMNAKEQITFSYDKDKFEPTGDAPDGWTLDTDEATYSYTCEEAISGETELGIFHFKAKMLKNADIGTFSVWPDSDDDGSVKTTVNIDLNTIQYEVAGVEANINGVLKVPKGYNGQAQQVQINIENPVGATIVYANETGNGSPDGTWSEDPVTLTEAGWKNFYAKISADGYRDALVRIEFVITPAEVTISPKDTTIYVGDAVPGTFDYEVSGLCGTDTLTTAPTFSIQGGSVDTSRPGTCTIVASGANAGANYNIKYNTATLTIVDRPSSGGGTYVPTYTNTVEKPEHGTVTVSPKNASKGQTVTITVTPDKGYELDWLFVTDKNGDELALTDKGNGKFTFKMPASKVSIEAWFTETAPVVVENPYVDVFESDYYYNEVLYAYENGLMVGNGDTFAPKASFDRKQLAMLLWNMEGKPVVNYAMSFNDVPAGQWYTEAIRWAASTGVMTGYGADTFGTDDLLTRQQMATAFFRYAEAKAEKGDLNDFTDGAQVADWAADGMVWAVNHGLFQGYNNCLTPGATANRAQVAIILYRYCENIA